MKYTKIIAVYLALTQFAWAGLPPATTQGGNDASKVTTFNLHLPGRAITHVGVDAWVPTPQKAKEYIQNGDFESNSVTGWTLCNTTLTSGIPTGAITNTAASFNALATTATNPVAGTYSLSVSSAAATTAGQGFCSSTFTLDAEDSTISPRVQTIRASYSGTANMNFSGTSSNTWAVYVYDVTNSQWIQPAGVYDFVGDGKVVATFQPNITSSQYKLVLLNVNASIGAISMKWDSFSVGPQAVSIGPAMSDWQSASFSSLAWTGLGTVTNNLQVRRVGDSLQIRGKFTTGTVTASTVAIPLPINFGASAIASSVQTNEIFGFNTRNAASTNIYESVFGSANGTALSVSSPLIAAAASPVSAVVGTTGFASGESEDLDLTIPISGWSSSTVQSSDSDTRIVAMMAYGPSSAAAAGSPIIFPNVFKDTHGAYNAATGQYTAPSSGWYQVQAASDGTITGGNDLYVSVAGNTAAGPNRPFVGVVTTTNAAFAGQATVYATQGQTIDIRCTAAYGAGSISSDTFQITKVSGPAVTQATESVSARVYGAATSVGTADTTIIYPSKTWDTHNAYNTSTGAYVCPTPGKYKVTTDLEGPSINGTINSSASATIYKNGVAYASYAGSMFVQTVTARFWFSGSTDVDCAQGDSLVVKMAFPSAAAIDVTSSAIDWTTFERVGN